MNLTGCPVQLEREGGLIGVFIAPSGGAGR